MLTYLTLAKHVSLQSILFFSDTGPLHRAAIALATSRAFFCFHFVFRRFMFPPFRCFGTALISLLFLPLFCLFRRECEAMREL
jgi:hypothetical protein